ncbi:haloacid dehalogenase type II [Rhodobacterales bacterium HKCCE3408]|nr:haloacid dehalogenase type II [Rhodobacterales bacterium HKCCE3408]
MAMKKACVFDAYGTLFDVNAAAREVAGQPGKEGFSLVWQQVAQDWRLKQLQYTWLRTIEDRYADFWTLTQDALDWALEAADQAEATLREELLGLYWSLHAYPEVPKMLAELSDKGIQAAILSNGTKDMLAAAVDNAGIGGELSAVLSVEDVGVYKPAREVYDMVGDALGTEPDEVLFVSSNGWDAAGAAAYGFDTLWVNRAGEPMDRLPGRPERVAGDLAGVAGIAAGSAG